MLKLSVSLKILEKAGITILSILWPLTVFFLIWGKQIHIGAQKWSLLERVFYERGDTDHESVHRPLHVVWRVFLRLKKNKDKSTGSDSLVSIIQYTGDPEVTVQS